MSNYLEIKKRFNGDIGFIGYVEKLDDHLLAEFFRGILYSRHVDNTLFEALEKFFHSNKNLLSSRLKSAFNLMYIFDTENLESDFLWAISIPSKLLSYFLSGRLGRETSLIQNYLATIESIPEWQITYLRKFFFSKNVNTKDIHKDLIYQCLLPKYIKSRPRVALLISGQIRGIETAMRSWKNFFSFDEVDLDIFISTWEHSGQPSKVSLERIKGNHSVEQKIAEMRSQGSKDEEILKYLKRYLPPGIITKKYLSEICRTNLRFNKLSIEIEKDEEFSLFTNPMKLYYKIYKAFELSKKEGVYDLYIRIRPDLFIDTNVKYDLVSAFNVLKSGARKILSHYPYIYEYYGFGVDDKFAILNRPGIVGDSFF